ncbi:MAG: hypothetical protein EOQ98_19910 [Mesorhizobium sp.]|uniref:hypothetical protein n=1 Tax=unclassified Mesorhizobium TaxID=325217 RepID=UPI000FCA9436|nr:MULTISPECIES: hypothetical protein [unclassified Mesorhizobium]RUU26843.1 hypothetical protein EOC94_25245 [Mesorhizobium sp. M6A.T.Ce.TU.016.01.1.1]RUU98324.1 hypothetical protein EOB36_24060 [Mesorhizobium sp. M6A.T.Cr.TU.017.01.1.1]RWO97286.1 MAG: hypothetical protein EOQ98_19910 [Mesorhizobium sp.]
MRTISRLFDSRDQAARAVAALQAAGVSHEQISVIGPYDDEIGAVLRGPGGAALGAAAGLLIGLWTFGTTGIDPVGAAAGLTLVGGACGGFAGGLLQTLAKKPGEPNLVQGVILVMAHVDENQADTAQAALGSPVPLEQLEATAG